VTTTTTGMVEEFDRRWNLLDSRELGILRTLWQTNRAAFHSMKEEMLSRAAATQRSREHWDRRKVDQWLDAAPRRGVSEQDAQRLVDLSDLDDSTRERLIELRQRGDWCLYATEVGLARESIREAARNQDEERNRESHAIQLH
jgi:hypothetical protein